jgi:hypothetical protein
VVLDVSNVGRADVSPSPRRPAAIVIGACAAVIVGSCDSSSRSDVVVTDRPDIATTVAYNPPLTSALETTSGASERLNLDGPRGRTQSVWTGEEIVIWGGHDEGRIRSFADGAAFNPVNRTWRVLSSSPLDASGAPTLSVWAGDRVVFVQGNQARLSRLGGVTVRRPRLAQRATS